MSGNPYLRTLDEQRARERRQNRIVLWVVSAVLALVVVGAVVQGFVEGWTAAFGSLAVAGLALVVSLLVGFVLR